MLIKSAQAINLLLRIECPIFFFFSWRRNPSSDSVTSRYDIHEMKCSRISRRRRGDHIWWWCSCLLLDIKERDYEVSSFTPETILLYISLCFLCWREMLLLHKTIISSLQVFLKKETILMLIPWQMPKQGCRSKEGVSLSQLLYSLFRCSLRQKKVVS